MLWKVGKVFSRLFLAGAFILLIWAVVIFFRTGSWQPVNLAETLAFYGLSVPDFGLPGLAAIYGVAGKIWLLAYLLAIGLMIAFASANAAPGSTKEYMKAILLLPVTIASLTIGGFFSVVRGILKYTFVSVTTLVALTCVWWGANYLMFAHQFSDSASCALRQTVFGGINFNFIYDCADAGGVSATADRRYYVLFMASQEIPDPAHTGHAWLATAALKKASGGEFLLTDYEVTGYGPPGGPASTECYPALTWLYLALRPALPFASPIEQYWCLRGAVGNEGHSALHDPAGVPLPKPTTPEEVDAMLGVNPAVVFAVSVSEEQYDRALHIIKRQTSQPSNYQLGLNDCTTFVRDIAQAIGLYVPPRLLAPYPSNSIYAIMQYNLKQKTTSAS